MLVHSFRMQTEISFCVILSDSRKLVTIVFTIVYSPSEILI